MATKNITIEMDVYERLKAMKGPSESFSQVLRRAIPAPRASITACDLLKLVEDDGGVLQATPEQLNDIERVRKESNKGLDPWIS